LTPGDLSAIEAAVAGVTVQGDRYPAHLQPLTGRVVQDHTDLIPRSLLRKLLGMAPVIASQALSG
jgi:hypothetical protein